jgi:hypothetical protein
LRPELTLFNFKGIKKPQKPFSTGSGVGVTAKTKSKNLILINFFTAEVKE